MASTTSISAVKPTSTLKTTTATPAPTEEEEPLVDFKVLGITIGSILALILLILAILWIIKCLRKRADPKAAKENEAQDAERAHGNGNSSAMAIVLTAVTPQSSTNPPRLLGNDKRHNRNRTLGSSAGGSVSTARGKGSISNPTYVPHTTTDAFSQKNYKHFPISRPLPVHQEQSGLGSQTGRAAGPMPRPAINFNHPQRPMSRGNSGAGRPIFRPSNVVRPLRPSVVGAAPVMLPRQATTQGVLAPPSSSSGIASSSGVGTVTTSSSGVGVGVAGSTPARDDGTRRSSGWNRYWSGGSALNMMGFNRNSSKEDRKSSYTTQSGSHPSDQDQDSVYSTDVQGGRVVSDHGRYIPPPLNFGQGERMSQVSVGSPVVHLERGREFPLQSGRVGHMSGRDSVSSLSSYGEDPIDAFSSMVPTSEPEAQQWNPLAAHDWNGGNRGTSSVYTDENWPDMPRRATLVDSYYAKSHQGHQYELKLPQQGQEPAEEQRIDRRYLEPPKANTKRRRSVVAVEQGYQQQLPQQYPRQPPQQQNRNIIPDLLDEYGRLHIYPTQEQQRFHQQQRMRERGDGAAQQRYQQQQHKMNQQVDQRVDDGAYEHYQPRRTQHAQRDNPEPRSDDMSWLNLGR